jgi:DNA polymerase-3 subunit epsilon
METLETSFFINLTKPLAFIDLETTGVNVSADRIVEISILKIAPDNSKESYTKRYNPTIPIPIGASKVHGIFDADVKDFMTFKEDAENINLFLHECDLAGFNSNKFDVPLLIEEFSRAGIDFDMNNRRLVDVQTIFHKMEARNLGAAYKFYCNKNLDNAHSAEADIIATFEIFKAQLLRYSELKNDIDFLHTFSSQKDNVDFAARIVRDENGKEIFNFGKHKGKLVEEVFKKESSYYDWMMNGDFAQNTKKVITAIYKRSKAS